jgi:hypothetical protein
MFWLVHKLAPYLLFLYGVELLTHRFHLLKGLVAKTTYVYGWIVFEQTSSEAVFLVVCDPSMNEL